MTASSPQPRVCNVDESQPLVKKEGEINAAGARVFTTFVALLVPCMQTLVMFSLQFLLKDFYKVDPATIDFITAPVALVWGAKPIWGFISDSFPIVGSRRQSYATLSAILVAVGLSMLGHWARNLWQVAVSLYITNIGLAFLVVVAQAIVVEVARGGSFSNATDKVTSYFLVRQIGLASGSMMAGISLDYGLHPETVYAYAALVPLAILVSALFIGERRVSRGGSDSQKCWEDLGVLTTFFRQPVVYGPALFIFASAALPRPSQAMFFFYTNILGFSSKFIATISVVSLCCGMLGMAAYYMFLQGCNLRKLFLAINLIVACLSLTPLILIFRWNLHWGIKDTWFVLFDDGLIAAAAEVMVLPLMTLCARCCPKNVEGTMFACFTAMFSIGMFTGSQISGLLTGPVLGITQNNLSNLWLLKIICSTCCLLPLMLLPLVPATDDEVTRMREDAEKPSA